MGDDDGQAAVFSEGFVVPISGLLALLFALFAGVALGNAIGGDGGLVDFALPVSFAAVSLLAFRLRQRARAAREAAGNGDGGDGEDDDGERAAE